MPTLEIAYDRTRRMAILTCAGGDAEEWFGLLLRAIRDQGAESEQRGQGAAGVPWGQFLGMRRTVQEVCSAYDVNISAEPEARLLLQEAKARIASYAQALAGRSAPQGDIEERLRAAGFVRKLSPEQLRNVARMAQLPAAATFSVPGAGKTTEALAYFALRAADADPLLVVAPKNALSAWDEQLTLCFGESAGQFVRLRGGEANIEQLLRAPGRFSIITYQQLARDHVPQYVADFVASHRTFVFIDESHRIKGRGVTTETVLALAFLPQGKLIMSGTPMPQATDDLVPQFGFLYPEVNVTPADIVDKVRPIFVRTTKAELGLPEPRRLSIPLAMLPAQRKLYGLLLQEVVRQAESTLTAMDRNAFRALGRSVMRVLQLVSNPALLVASWGARSDLLATAIEEGDSPKLAYSCGRTRQLVSQGKKVLLWSAFRGNVEVLAGRLADLGAVYIHGNVDAGDESDEATREGRLRRFHDDPQCHVLVANPAAAGEGISLHSVCHNAIYVDRTYNAAHYLQSEDRIHRLGTEIAPVIEIVQCADSIDQAVAARLEAKAQQMASALDDPSLRISPKVMAFEPDDESEDDPTLGLNMDDVRHILTMLGGRPGHG